MIAFQSILPVRSFFSPISTKLCGLRATNTSNSQNKRRINSYPSLQPSNSTITSALAFPSTALSSAVSSASPFLILFTLLSSATIGLLSAPTKWGATLSPPVVTTLITLFLANLGILPTSHPIYSAVLRLVVPLAIPLLLLSADLKRIVGETGRLLLVFFVGSFATVFATLVAWKLIPLASILGSDAAWKIAAALCARHIGGAVNYIAVADATAAPADAVTSALAADNVVVALYFTFLFLLARGVFQPSSYGKKTLSSSDSNSTNITTTTNTIEDEADKNIVDKSVKITTFGIVLSISAVMCAMGAIIAELIPLKLGIIPIVTALVLVTASVFPKQLRPYHSSASTIGIFFMQIFFAVTGAGGSIVAIANKAPILLMFSAVQIGIHWCVLFGVGKLLRFHTAEMLLSSNANVGGPSTASAMAAAKQWDHMIVPALLIGVFGYSIATFLSLGIGYSLLKPV